MHNLYDNPKYNKLYSFGEYFLIICNETYIILLKKDYDIYLIHNKLKSALKVTQNNKK